MNHDAAMAVVEFDKKGPGKILWAAHSERYSKIKNDHYLNWDIVNEALTHGPFNKIVYYEKPILKKTRQFYATQFKIAFDRREMPEYHLKQFGLQIDQKDLYPTEWLSHPQRTGRGYLYPSLPLRPVQRLWCQLGKPVRYKSRLALC